jgi:hypothetical protein
MRGDGALPRAQAFSLDGVLRRHAPGRRMARCCPSGERNPDFTTILKVIGALGLKTRCSRSTAGALRGERGGSSRPTCPQDV